MAVGPFLAKGIAEKEKSEKAKDSFNGYHSNGYY